MYFHGDVAIFTGDYTETGTRDGVEYSEAGLFTETWVKRSGEWVIVGSVFPYNEASNVQASGPGRPGQTLSNGSIGSRARSSDTGCESGYPIPAVQ